MSSSEYYENWIVLLYPIRYGNDLSLVNDLYYTTSTSITSDATCGAARPV